MEMRKNNISESIIEKYMNDLNYNYSYENVLNISKKYIKLKCSCSAKVSI